MEKDLVSRLAGDILLPAIGSLVRPDVFRAMRRFRENERRSADELRESNWRSMQALLAWSVERVPYYRELFQSLGAAPQDIRTPADFQQIPVLTREIINERFADLQAEGFPANRRIEGETSGSTGDPMRFVISREYQSMNIAKLLRNLSWSGIDIGCRKAVVWGSPGRSEFHGSFAGRIALRALRIQFFDAARIGEDAARSWAHSVMRFRPSFLYGYASGLSRFASYVRDAELQVPRIPVIGSTAERLFPEQRELVEKVFGGRVFDQYGSREASAIAAECTEGSLHVNSDLVHVEFTSRPEAPSLRHVTITPLFNYAMPLIRYRNGDVASPKQGPCTCGLPYERMKLSISRVYDYLVSPENELLHGHYFTSLMRGISGIEHYQFHQVNRTEIHLNVVRNRRFTEDSDRRMRALPSRIHREVSPNIRLRIRYLPEIPLTKHGKHRFTITDVPHTSRA